MQPISFEEAIKKIAAADPRFPAEAYFFVQEALQHTQQRTLGPAQDRGQPIVGGKGITGRAFAITP